MLDGAIPAAPNGGTPPTSPAATPPEGTQGETVTLKKEEHAQLERNAARAASNQSKADRYDRMVGGKGKGRFGAPATAAAPAIQTADERAAQASEEDIKAERGLQRIAVDPQYREVLDADPTLRDLLIGNPLGALPILAPDAFDAEDAIALVTEKLVARRDALKKSAPTATTPPETPPTATPPAPPAGGVNTPSTQTSEEVEAAKKNPNTEQAIAGMIRIGVKNMPGGKKV